MRSLSNPKRAVAWTVATVAFTGVVVGFGIAATTRSVNAGAGAGAAVGSGSSAGGATSPSTRSASGVSPSSDPGVSRPGTEPASAQALAPVRAVSPPGAAPALPTTTSPRNAPHPPSSQPNAPAAGAGSPPTAPSTSTSPSPPSACTAGDLVVTTTTDASRYSVGSPVTVTTTIEDVATCVLVPVPTGAYSCGTSVTVADAGGSQVWPVPGQSEQCAQPSPSTLDPGATISVTVVWTGLSNLPGTSTDVPAPPGSYTAKGTWSWAGPSGQGPVTVSATSVPFTME